MSDELFEQLDFTPNPLYEKIISDLLEQHYSVVPGFLSGLLTTALRSLLLERFEADRFRQAAIGNQLNEQIRPGIRGDFIYWLKANELLPPEAEFFQELDQLIAYLNRTCFLGIASREFHYALYPEGSYYQRHLDVFQNDDRRRLSLICYLNEGDWTPADGGQLVLYTPGENGEKAVWVDPLPGQLVLMESHILEHEVKPTHRPRLSLTGWFKTH